MQWPDRRSDKTGRDPFRPERDAAVSSVVGTVMMVSVTVIVFGGVAAVVFDQVGDAPDSETARLAVASRDDQSLIITHQGGEPLPLDDITIRLVVNGTQETVATSALADQTGDGRSWVIGESMCVIGASSLCLHPPGTTISEVQVIFNNNLLVHNEPGGSA